VGGEPGMKEMNKERKVKSFKYLSLSLILLLITIIISSNVLALGVAPSSTELVFSPESEHVVDLAIINNDNKDMTVVIYAEGELAEHVSIPEPLIEISSSQPKVKTSYTVNMPKKLKKQGLHETNIVVREIPRRAEGETAVGASLAIISKLKVFVPYKGKYAEIKLMAPHFELNKPNNFAVEVNNLGTEKILTGYVVIDIYGPLNNKIKTLISQEFSLDSKQKTVVIVPWTPDIGSGQYVAEATLVYDELNVKDRKEFTLGELSVEIVSISVENFRLGGIAKFDILVANNWNTQVPSVYAVTTVTDEKGDEYLRFKTASVDVPGFGREKLEAYWDTARVSPGPYKLDIVLNYLGKTSKKLFDIKVEQNRILVSAAAVAPVAQSTIMKIVYILIVLVGILIVANVLLFLRGRKRGMMFLCLLLFSLLIIL
jgi:methionine-rich copper-binding protein CopC